MKIVTGIKNGERVYYCTDGWTSDKSKATKMKNSHAPTLMEFGYSAAIKEKVDLDSIETVNA